jgi:PAS domain-containing protein
MALPGSVMGALRGRLGTAAAAARISCAFAFGALGSSLLGIEPVALAFSSFGVVAAGWSARRTSRIEALTQLLPGLEQSLRESQKRAEVYAVRGRELQARFEAMAKSLRELYFLFDLTHCRFVYLGPVFERLTGKRRQEAYENPQAFFDAFEPESHHALAELLQGRRNGEWVELWLSTKDSNARRVRCLVEVAEEEEGYILRGLAVAMRSGEQQALSLAAARTQSHAAQVRRRAA